MKAGMKASLCGVLRKRILVSVGYGIVCGLTFPLMVSSTFLSAMNLSHNAGESFGAFFFLSYSISMICLALLAKSKSLTLQRRVLASAFCAVFLGNALMLGAFIGLIENQWIYAISVSLLLGYGLAALELGWISHIALLEQEERESNLPASSRVIAFAYIVGGIMAALIFILADELELCFALASIAISGVAFFRIELPDGRKKTKPQRAVDYLGFAKAVLYLGVFSFVFGAISQVVLRDVWEPYSIEIWAAASIVLAACLMLAVVTVNARVVSVSGFYSVLFPVVALTLIVLPFSSTPSARVASVVLVFVAYYLSGMNVRSVICGYSGASVWLFAGIALGLGGLLVLAGVSFGAVVLSGDETALALAFVSLVSLFVLSLNSFFSQRLDARFSKKSIVSNDDEKKVADRLQLVRDWALACGMTEREVEVAMMVGQGRTRAYIAESLGISPNTVKGYIHNVYQKAGVSGKQELIDCLEALDGFKEI